MNLNIIYNNINDEYFILNFFSSNGKINKYRLNKITKEELSYLNNRYNYFDSIKEVLFRIYRHIEDRPVCEICGKPVIFWGTSRAIFSKTCSTECSKILNKQNRTKTNLEKYGTDNPSKTDNIKEKISNTKKTENKEEINLKRKQTCLKKYGVENCFQSEEKKDKAIQTKLNRYNNKNYNNLEKNKQTCLKRYGVEYPTQTEKVKYKIKQTKLKKYGDETYNNYAKAMQTCIERYGVTSPMKLDIYKDYFSKKAQLMWTNEDIVNKIKQTNINKYGTPFYLQSEEFKIYISKLTKTLEYINKRKQTCKEKYGVDFVLQYSGFTEQARKTCIEKYGYEYYTQQPSARQHLSEVMLSPDMKKRINETKQKNGTFNTSQPEEKCYEILKECYPDIIRQYTDERYPFNCDFYIPSKDLFIEYQGTWTHGFKPFEGTKEDLLKLQEWTDKNTEYYNNAINTWTIRDVKKRNTAKKNKLNYIELWNLSDINKCL